MPFTFKDGSVAGTCSICGEPGWSIRSNKCELHRVPQKEKKPKATKTTNADGSKKPVVTQVVEAAGEITTKTFSGKAPTASEWEEKLTALVVLLTMTYVEYVVVRPFELGEPDATNAVASLGMTDDEASTIVEPFSYMLSKSEINKKHGREAIELLAFAPALLAIVAWADRVAQFRREMVALQGGAGGETHVRFESPAAPQSSSPAGGGPPLANFRGVTDPSQAPTARVNGDRAHVDLEDRSFS
jgi:hypothetical protein